MLLCGLNGPKHVGAHRDDRRGDHGCDHGIFYDILTFMIMNHVYEPHRSLPLCLTDHPSPNPSIQGEDSNWGIYIKHRCRR